MKKSKTIITVCMCTMLFLCNNISVSAAESQDLNLQNDMEMSREELCEFYELDKLADKYGMNADELTDAYYEGIHSDYFSPFSLTPGEEVNPDKTVDYVAGTLRTYIAYSQDSTMYLSTGNPCASGKYPYLGCVAVHRKSSSDTTPVISFGTIVRYEDDSVNINGANYESFVVEDTGDPNYNRSLYWTDVYGGANTAENRKMATNYGIRTVDISW